MLWLARNVSGSTIKFNVEKSNALATTSITVVNSLICRRNCITVS